MPLIASAAADWHEDDPSTGLIGSIQSVLDLRYPAEAAALMRDVRYILDLDRLTLILRLAKLANLTEIQAAIESAVPPPN